MNQIVKNKIIRIQRKIGKNYRLKKNIKLKKFNKKNELKYLVFRNA